MKRKSWPIIPVLAFAGFFSLASQTSESLGLNGPVRFLSTSTETYAYNVDGVTTSARRLADSEFNRAGSTVIIVTYGYDGSVSQKQLLEYDEKNRLVRQDNRNRDGVLFSTQETVYGEERRAVSQYNYGRQGKKLLTSKRVYDAADRLVLSEGYYTDTNGETSTLSSRWEAIGNDRVEKYQYTKFNSQGVLTNREEAVYTAEGMLAELTAFSSSGTYRYVYQYGKDGRLQRVDYYHYGRMRDTWTFEYDDEGRPVGIVYFFNNGSPSIRQEYTYIDGRLSEKRSRQYGRNGNLLYTHFYLYDDAGNVIEKKLVFSERERSYTWTTAYSESGAILESSLFNDAGIYLEGSRREYDVKGGQLLVEETFGRNGIPAVLKENIFDLQKNPVLQATENFAPPSYSEVRRRYDTGNHLVNEACYNRDGSLIRETGYEYEFDIYGNWIKMSVFDTVNSAEYYRRIARIEKRTIEYY